MTDIFSPLTLPNGAVMSNRICKAAMEENMAEYGQVPGQALINLYQRWADGGPGLILTGNVMVAPDAMTGPGGVYLGKGVLDDPKLRPIFENWAKAGKSGGSQMFMQISHPGRQVYGTMGTEVVSASDTKLDMEGPAAKMFKAARALTETEIKTMIERYADTAQAAQAAGFDGVQVHAAHGYLVAQFLSPLSNLRDDDWGGSLESRARFLLEIVRAVRARTGSDFGVAVKLNSADFQRGGFDVEDAKQVVTWLNDEAVDFVELSGGNYESAAMAGLPAEGELSSTLSRELYFIDFAKDISAAAKMPLMVTGGVTKLETAAAALETGGVDIIGIARSYGYNANLAADWAAGKNTHVPLPEIKSKNKTFKVLAGMAMTKENLYRMGDGHPPKTKQSALLAVIRGQLKQAKQTKRYKAWLDEENAA